MQGEGGVPVFALPGFFCFCFLRWVDFLLIDSLIIAFCPMVCLVWIFASLNAGGDGIFSSFLDFLLSLLNVR